MRGALLVTLLMAAAGCAQLPQGTPDLLLLGEQHDVPEHQRLHARVVHDAVARGTLAALALEMSEQGRSTASLAKDASEADVRTALAWDEKAWPWPAYGPAVMTAVRAGVPVAGVNPSRARLREAAADAQVEAGLAPAVLQGQVEEVRQGHCGLLPESQLRPMARMQIARDREMAQGAVSLARPGRTVVLITGARHANPALGVPLHVAQPLRVVSHIWPGQDTGQDYCADLRKHWQNRAVS